MSGKAHGGTFQLSGNAQNRPTGLAYDAAGNLMSYLSATYTYDQENRLSSTAGMSYRYDGNGERVLKSNTSTGAAVKRYWSMGGNTLTEGDGSGNLTAEYIYCGGKRIARIDLPANTVHYYLSDHLGSTSVVVSAAGAVEEESDYYPFGTEVVVTGPGVNHYKFNGKERDSETGLDYYGARYYSNPLGRFLTPDWTAKATAVPYAEFFDPQSLNLYTYVRNIPTTRYDVDGHCPDGICYNIAAKTPAQIDHLAKATPQVMIGQGKALVNSVTSTVNIGVNAATHGGTYIPGTTPEIPQLQPKNEAQAAGMITMNAGLAATGVVTGGAAIVDLTSTVTAPSTINLFRAIGSAEADSIEATGGFSAAPNGTEFKGFFFDEGDASSFASRMTDMTGDTHSVVSAEAPTDLVNSSPIHDAGTEGPGTLIRNENLPQVKVKDPQ